MAEEKIAQKIYVGNVPFAATEKDLTDFLKLPAKTEVEMPVFRYNPGRKMGFAFVTVELASVEGTLKFNGEEMMGRKLKVALAKPEKQSKPDRWQKDTFSKSTGSGGAAVMVAKPHRSGIPQEELRKLQRLREKLATVKSDVDVVTEGVKKLDISKLQMVDVAANLTNFRFNNNLEMVISRALARGVHKMVVCSSTLEDSQQAIILAETLPGVLYCTVGVHPHQAKSWTTENGVLLRSLLDNPQVVAIGECGLDYFRMLSSTKKQLEAFEEQVQIACDVKKPLFVHDRSSKLEVLEVLLNYYQQLPATLIHCFTGTEKEAIAYVKHGFYIGVTGFVTKQDRGKMLRSILMKKVIPLDRLVIETDCPFMMPAISKDDFHGVDFTDVMRWRSNEPCTLVLVANCVAQCYGVSLEEVVDTTTRNANKIFNL